MRPSLPDWLISCEKYNLVRKDRNVHSKKGGGLCLYIRNSINYEQIGLIGNQDVYKDLE